MSVVTLFLLQVNPVELYADTNPTTTAAVSRPIRCQTSPALVQRSSSHTVRTSSATTAGSSSQEELRNTNENSPSPVSSGSNEGSQDSLQRQSKRKGIMSRIFQKKDKDKQKLNAKPGLSSSTVYHKSGILKNSTLNPACPAPLPTKSQVCCLSVSAMATIFSISFQ